MARRKKLHLKQTFLNSTNGPYASSAFIQFEPVDMALKIADCSRSIVLEFYVSNYSISAVELKKRVEERRKKINKIRSYLDLIESELDDILVKGV